MEEVFEKRSNLVMPTHYVELDSEEMSYVEAGWGIFGTIVGGITSAVKSVINGSSFKNVVSQTVKGAVCGFAGATVFYFLGRALACAIPGLNLGILAGATIGFGVG